MVAQGRHRIDAAPHLVLIYVQDLDLHLQLMVPVPVFAFRILRGLTKAKHSQWLHPVSKGRESLEAGEKEKEKACEEKMKGSC